MKRLVTLATALAATMISIGFVHGQERPGQPTPAAQTQPSIPPGPAFDEAMQRRQQASVDIEDLLAKVSASTGKEFLIDPRVRARVFAVPRIENPTYADLLSILRMHGYMAIEIAGRVNILPDANARNMPVRLLQRDDDTVPDDEWVTRIITVPAAPDGDPVAPQLVPILRPMMPQAAHLAATADGKLILVDTYANVRRMTELINALTR